jgi:hypothetical protein
VSTELYAEAYPVDFEALKKGDTIPAEKIEEIFNTRRTDADYSLYQMKLRSRIIGERRKMGRPVSVRCDGPALVILTDSEASQYQARRCETALDKLADGNLGLQEVDVQNLREDEMKYHERRQLVSGAMLAGAIGAKKQAIKALPHQRQTPGLPE